MALIDIYKKSLKCRQTKPDEISINCINCSDSKKHLGINFTLGVFHCFKCDFSGSIKKLNQLLFKSEIADYYDNYNQYDLRIKEINYETKFPNKLPDDFIPLLSNSKSDICNFDFRKKYIEYLINRGLTLLQIMYYNFGISLSQKYSGHVILPIYDIHGEIVYWTTRAIYDCKCKALFPKFNKDYYNKSDVVFNLLDALKFDNVYITEGWADALSLNRRSAIALLGKKISDNQFKMLCEAQFKKYYICLDPEAKKENYELAKMFRQYFEDVFTISYKDNRDLNQLYVDGDINSIRFNRFDYLKEI
jgi:hypothetical protein